MDGQPTLSKILISIVIAGLVLTGLSLYIGDIAVKYSTNGTFDESNQLLATYVAEAEQTTESMETAQKTMLNVEEDQSLLDRLGSFFRGGYDAAKSIFNSLTNMNRLVSVGVNEIPYLGSFKGILISSLTAIVLIILVVYILLHFLIKSDRG